MALNGLKRICAKIESWLNECEEEMNQWRKEDPDSYFAFMEEQQQYWRGGRL